MRIKKSALIPFMILSFVLFSSCMSMERKQQWFIDQMNYDVGRPFKNIPVPEPSKVTPIDREKSKYIVELGETGCKVIYIVDDVTQKVMAWRYASAQEKCYIENKWGGPW